MRKSIRNILGGVLLVASAFEVSAQSGGNYDLGWSVIAGGGGLSAGSTLSLSGTIGQAGGGSMSAGNYSLGGGFWAVPTLGAPRLTLTRTGANVILSWPSSVAGYTLQSATDLAGKPVWTTVSQQQLLVSGQNAVTVPANQAKQFFRLKSQ